MLGYLATDVVNAITPADISDPRELVARARDLTLELGTPIAPGFEALVFKASRGMEDIYELTYIRKDGSRLPAVVSVTALRDESELIIGYLLIGTDNTVRQQLDQARKKLELELQQTNIELEAASRLKSEFLANMSHELRTPLNAIIGFSEVLKDGLVGNLTRQQEGFIDDIFKSGTHLLSLINDILDLSKVEAGKMTLDLEPVVLSALFDNSLSIIREEAAARRIRLSMDVTDDPGLLQADARKVKQIIYNLLSNAVKFTNVGGQVTLRASRVPCADVGRLSHTMHGLCWALPNKDFPEFIRITVSDTGIGIAPEALPNLFKPFSQIDSGLARRYEGTGLGLAMVRALAELHGGGVAVESTRGDGSCFTVWLPLRPAENTVQTADITHVPSAEIEVWTRTALIVEDDFRSAELIRMRLEAEGFTVLHAASAEAALALAVQQQLSLITLDIMLPNMDGWELLGRLKQVPALRHIPVVIISIVADRNKGFALGAAAVLQKPVSRNELYASLQKLGLFPLADGQSLNVLVVDDDRAAVERIATGIVSMDGTVIRAYSGRDAIDAARRELPDLIVLELMTPDVSGFDVVDALNKRVDTARIPIVVVTTRVVAAGDRTRLNGFVTAIMEKTDFDPIRFTAEVRRAMSSRHPVA